MRRCILEVAPILTFCYPRTGVEVSFILHNLRRSLCFASRVARLLVRNIAPVIQRERESDHLLVIVGEFMSISPTSTTRLLCSRWITEAKFSASS